MSHPYIILSIAVPVALLLLFWENLAYKLSDMDNYHQRLKTKDKVLKKFEEHPFLAMAFLTELYREILIHENDIHARSFFAFLRDEVKLSNGTKLKPPEQYTVFIRRYTSYDSLEWKHVVKIHNIVAKYFVDHPDESVKFLNEVQPIKLLAIRSLDPTYEEYIPCEGIRSRYRSP